MVKQPPPTADPFFSGPFEPAEVDRLLGLIDERLSLRASLDLPSPPVAVDIDGQDMQAPLLPYPGEPLTAESLGELTAPFFNVRKAGRLGRTGKAILNLPLRVFGRPQLYFNTELRRVVGTWIEVLRTVVDVQAALCREVNAVKQAVARLERQASPPADGLATLEDRLRAVEARLGQLTRELPKTRE
jgi:hypothetical protein